MKHQINNPISLEYPPVSLKQYPKNSDNPKYQTGEILGKKQSRLPAFLIADLSFDADILDDVRHSVDELSMKDPKLITDKSKKLKNLLYLFEKDTAIKTLLAG